MTSTTVDPTPRPDKIVIVGKVWILERGVKSTAVRTQRCIVCGKVPKRGEPIYGPRDRHKSNPWRHVRFHVTCIDHVVHRPHRAAKIQMMPA